MEIVLVLEAPFAVGAVSVHVAIVFLDLCAVVEIQLIILFSDVFVSIVRWWRDEKRAANLFAWPAGRSGSPLHDPTNHPHHKINRMLVDGRMTCVEVRFANHLQSFSLRMGTSKGVHLLLLGRAMFLLFVRRERAKRSN